MPHGQPDFGMYSLAQTIYRMTDMGELAARLGSPDVFDRCGDVLLLTDFEDGIEGWKIELAGTGAGVEWTPDYKLRGGFSMKLTGGSDGGRYAKVTRELNYPVLSKMGFEISWTTPANLWKQEYRVILYDGSNKFEIGGYYDNTDGQGYLLTTGGIYVPLGSPAPVYTSDYLFYTSKVVADFVNRVYTRFITGSLSFDLSAVPISVLPSLELSRVEVSLTTYSKNTVNASVYVDSLIITQNEP